MVDVEEDIPPSSQEVEASTPPPVPLFTPQRPSKPKSQALSPPSEEVPEFASKVIAILQNVYKNNDAAIDYGVGEFCRQFNIYNEDTLSIISEDMIPTGPDNSIWSSQLFRKAFWVVCTGCSDLTLSKYTPFSKL